MSHLDHCICASVCATASLLAVYLGARAAGHLLKIDNAVVAVGSGGEKQAPPAGDMKKELLTYVQRGGYLCTMVIGGAMVWTLMREALKK